MRKLYAHEIDVRVGSTSKKGDKAMLLLYKDARCDMAVLDQTYGAEYWQSKYQRIGDVLYCSIGVYNKEIGEWVWKTSNGIESQGTGSDDPNNKKGEASDSFKRAGFMWGIGRELYEWKSIWISHDKNNDKYERYSVNEISYDKQGKPKDLIIVNSNNEIVYELRNGYFKKPSGKKQTDTSIQNKNDDKGKGASKKIEPQADNEPKDTKTSVVDKVKTINTKYYNQLYRMIIKELVNMNQRDELAHDIGDLETITKKSINHYVMADLKLQWNKVQLTDGDDENVFEGYLPININDAFKEIILNIQGVYGKTADEYERGDY